MDYHAALAYLDAHIGQGMKPGLRRIETLLEMMGHPEEGYPIIHVAGTNGKTSTSRIVTAILAAHGLNTGTFISPHLQRVEERIGVNGRQASPEEFAQAMSDVAAFADIFERRGTDRLTYFELTTAMGFAWFSEMAVDVGVVEVGLGGRLDATNAARGEVAVVTGIDFDHTEFLGDSLAQIAAEKLAITKDGATLVTGLLPPEALHIATRVADEQSARHLAYQRDFLLEGSSQAVGGWLCQVSGVEGDYDDIFLPLLGRHQVLNMTVAIAASEALLGRALDGEALRRGMESVTSPGRLEPIASDPLVVLDGAHNRQGFASLARAQGLDHASEGAPRREGFLLITFAVLLLFSGFTSAAETAIFSLGKIEALSARVKRRILGARHDVGCVADPHGPASPWYKVLNPDYSQKEGRGELFERRR